jgi:DNA-binding response OmpR family regulator
VIPGSGEEMLHRFRETPETHSTPILLISALHDLGARARRLGADGFLPKPFHQAELVEALEALMDRNDDDRASRWSP